MGATTRDKSECEAAHPVVPLLRWAGSKRSLLSVLLRRVPSQIGRYYEPFVGSASLFFAIAPSDATLGDLNADLIQAYAQVKSTPEDVGALVNKWPTTKDAYLEIRSNPPESLSPVERAARFIYLNRLCFNGIYRTNRQGQFNVPFGSRSGSMPTLTAFTKCSALLQRADLVTGDFESTIANAVAGDFVYLDPPYSQAVSDNYGVYGYGSFHSTDLPRLLDHMSRLHSAGANVLVSYRETAELTTLAPPWRVEKVAVRSQVGGKTSSRSTRSELLISNFRSRVPVSST